MQVVTEFNSDSKEESDPISDYRRLVDSLDRSPLEVVLNSFARVAKTEIRNHLPNAHYAEAKGARDLRPVWVCELSVALDIPEREKRTKEGMEKACWSLKDMVDSIRATIEHTDIKGVSLIDPLSPRIVQVGPHTYRFILKQKWCPDG